MVLHFLRVGPEVGARRDHTQCWPHSVTNCQHKGGQENSQEALFFRTEAFGLTASRFNHSGAKWGKQEQKMPGLPLLT